MYYVKPACSNRPIQHHKITQSLADTVAKRLNRAITANDTNKLMALTNALNVMNAKRISLLDTNYENTS